MKLSLVLILYAYAISCLVTDGLTFLYTTYGLQLYLNISHSNEERYYIRSTRSFGFIEASRICEYFLNSAFLSYETIYLTGDAVNSSSIDIICPDGSSWLSECVSTISTSVDQQEGQVINITCRKASEADSLVQLLDGTVAISTRVRGVLAWGHVCHEGSNWEATTAEPACASLGYSFVKSHKIRTNKKGVLGLYDFDCENDSAFDQCTFKISSNANGRCNTSFVVAIECCRDLESDCVSIDPNTNSPVVIATESSTASVDTGVTRSVSISHTTYTTVTPHASNNWVFIGAGMGIAWLFILASGIGLSVCIICWCFRDVREKNLQGNLSQILYANPDIPGTLRTREEQDPPPQNYYILP